MINESIKEFMDKITFKTSELALYEDKEKGVCYPLSIASLLVRVDMLELEKGNSKVAGALEKAIYEQKIDKKDYKVIDIEKPVSKYEITKVESDRFTITNKKCKGVRIYNVSNQLGIHTTFEDKEEAFKLGEELNKRIFEYMK
jgi:hypothetical protein